MLLFYIRHGYPTYEPDELTPLGKRQAEAVAKRLSLYGIDRIFSSTSNRAYQTAIPTAEILNKKVEQLDFCNEHYAWTEITMVDEAGKRDWMFAFPDIRVKMADPAVSRDEKWFTRPPFDKFPLQKGFERIDKSTDEWLLSLGYRHDRKTRSYEAVKPNNERVALFAHQGFGIAFLSSLLDIPYPEFSSHFDMSYTGVTVIDFDGSGKIVPRVLTLANDSHLYREGLPTKYNNTIDF